MSVYLIQRIRILKFVIQWSLAIPPGARDKELEQTQFNVAAAAGVGEASPQIHILSYTKQSSFVILLPWMQELAATNSSPLGLRSLLLPWGSRQGGYATVGLP